MPSGPGHCGIRAPAASRVKSKSSACSHLTCPPTFFASTAPCLILGGKTCQVPVQLCCSVILMQLLSLDKPFLRVCSVPGPGLGSGGSFPWGPPARGGRGWLVLERQQQQRGCAAGLGWASQPVWGLKGDPACLGIKGRACFCEACCSLWAQHTAPLPSPSVTSLMTAQCVR